MNIRYSQHALERMSERGIDDEAVEKVLQLQIRDEIIQQASVEGMAMRAEVDVKPGGYLVRVVIRDMDGQQTATRNVIVGALHK